VTKFSKAAAVRRFRECLKEAQRYADIEGREFAVTRDETECYTVRAVDDMTNYRQRTQIVKRVRRRTNPNTTSGENNEKEQQRGR
jgi:hypothetical protein